MLAREGPNVCVEWPGKSRRNSWVHLNKTKRVGDTECPLDPSDEQLGDGGGGHSSGLKEDPRQTHGYDLRPQS